MSALARFTQELLAEGRMCLDAAPRFPPDEDALPILQRAHQVACLDLAGPAIPFAPRAALFAASLVHHAAWYLLNPEIAIVEPQRTLHMPLVPTAPAHHLSADLVLRYLPAVQRRAGAHRAGDLLPQALAQTLRAWPLSGVLSDLRDGPLAPVTLGEHPGLLLLYAERLVRHERPGWFPDGPAAAYVELVWQQLGRDTSGLAHLQEMARELAHHDPKVDA